MPYSVATTDSGLVSRGFWLMRGVGYCWIELIIWGKCQRLRGQAQRIKSSFGIRHLSGSLNLGPAACVYIYIHTHIQIMYYMHA